MPSVANVGSSGNISAVRHSDLLWIWWQRPIIVHAAPEIATQFYPWVNNLVYICRLIFVANHVSDSA
jgi:hypothetical protein